MAAKRGKKQARRKGESSFNGLTWLLVGLLIGGAAMVGVWVKMPHAVDGLLPKPNPAAKPPAVSSTAGDVPEGNPPALASAASPATPATPAPKKPKYDFYTLLPEREVVIPDEELTKQVKAEAAANLAAKQQAALAADTTAAASPSTATPVAANPATTMASPAGQPSANAVSTTPKHASDTPASASVTKAGTPAATATTAASVAAAVPVPASQLKSGQYLLQAGAFRNDRQADDLKARIAMLGLIGRVETVQTAAGTLHRVRLGPYATASALEAAKDKLSAGGLPAVAIRVK